MKFINDKHRKFYYEKCNELESRKVVDVYYRSVIYSLGICEETRNNFNKIIDIEKGEIKVNSLSEGWQTGTSAKVTRLAFSLWNNCNYDSEKILKKIIFLKNIMLEKFFLVDMHHIFMKQ